MTKRDHEPRHKSLYECYLKEKGNLILTAEEIIAHIEQKFSAFKISITTFDIQNLIMDEEVNVDLIIACLSITDGLVLQKLYAEPEKRRHKEAIIYQRENPMNSEGLELIGEYEWEQIHFIDDQNQGFRLNITLESVDGIYISHFKIHGSCQSLNRYLNTLMAGAAYRHGYFEESIEHIDDYCFQGYLEDLENLNFLSDMIKPVDDDFAQRLTANCTSWGIDDIGVTEEFSIDESIRPSFIDENGEAWYKIPLFRETPYTSYTLLKHQDETKEERLERMEYLFKQFLKIKDQLPLYTVGELDTVLKEKFNVTIIDEPLPLSQFEEYELNSLGEDEAVTEEDIVRIYQFKDTEVNTFLKEQEKKSLFYESREFEDVQDELQEYYEDILSGEDDIGESLFPNGFENLSKEEIFTILYDDFINYDDGPLNIILESKDGCHITGYTGINESSTLVSALLFITTNQAPTEKDYDIKDSWFQEYLEALVWGGWIEDKD